MRGIELPGWTSPIGHAITSFWTEVYVRGQQTEVAKTHLETYGRYLMAGLSPQVELETRLKALQPFLDDVMANLDHTAYTPQHARARLLRQLQEQHEKLAGLKYVQWLDSEEFSLEDWLAGKEKY